MDPYLIDIQLHRLHDYPEDKTGNMTFVYWQR